VPVTRPHLRVPRLRGSRFAGSLFVPRLRGRAFACRARAAPTSPSLTDL